MTDNRTPKLIALEARIADLHRDDAPATLDVLLDDIASLHPVTDAKHAAMWVLVQRLRLLAGLV